MGPTKRRQTGKRQPGTRRRRRTMAMLASALVTLPAALSADVAVNFVTAADQGPLNVPRSNGPQGDSSVPAALGATGATPHDTTLSPQLVHNAGNSTALSQGLSTGSNGQPANLPNGPLGIPGVVLDAYLHAQQVLGVSEPNCHLPWWLLAGIGKIESGQAEGGEVDSNGTTFRPILGPELNGSNGFAALPAILGGRWTGDPVWQRAVGPMQFLPSTWLQWGNGGNPNNVYDASLAAGRYLCAGGRDLSQPAQQAAAVFSYNHSDHYVQIVLVWANAYRSGVHPLPETPVAPQGPRQVGHPVIPQGGSTQVVSNPTGKPAGATPPGSTSKPSGSTGSTTGTSMPTLTTSPGGGRPSPTYTLNPPPSTSPSTTPPLATTTTLPPCPTDTTQVPPTDTTTPVPPPTDPTCTTPPAPPTTTSAAADAGAGDAADAATAVAGS
ncbi:MAG TPA: lytic murein transglycosylase [Pseudonocardiaceae bacterium]|nr:lytic murein transglycosylase [Pseudonocardiaceae bacterium]